MIRVGRAVWSKTEKDGYVWPETNIDGQQFTPIKVLTKSSEYGALSPYVLRDAYGRIMENIYQASKIYPHVPTTTAQYTVRQPRIVWSWPAETHVINGGISPAYFRWRTALMNNPEPVRYPVGYQARNTCIGSIKPDLTTATETIPAVVTLLNYVDARKQIYEPLYINLVRQQKQFAELLQRHQNGENLLIIEVDGPHQESLQYYMEKYGVNPKFITGSTILASPQNLDLMLNDTKHPYGHGYCLARALMM
jgi:hypothetical protein